MPEKSLAPTELCVRMTFANCKEEMKNLFSQAYTIFCRKKESSPTLTDKSFQNLMDTCVSTSLIALKCFTGGTVTNSYSESVNSMPRKHVLNW